MNRTTKETEEKNSKERSQLKKSRRPYSDKKMIANRREEYSVLNPDTSSDSPSAKSNGARCLSATTVNKNRNPTNVKRRTHKPENSDKLNPRYQPDRENRENHKNEDEISYERN